MNGEQRVAIGRFSSPFAIRHFCSLAQARCAPTSEKLLALRAGCLGPSDPGGLLPARSTRLEQEMQRFAQAQIAVAQHGCLRHLVDREIVEDDHVAVQRNRGFCRFLDQLMAASAVDQRDEFRHDRPVGVWSLIRGGVVDAASGHVTLLLCHCIGVDCATLLGC
jgi:hypothetical protein